VNALEQKQLLKREKVKSPSTLMEPYPGLRDFAEPG
jgi:hypothetical protein